MPVVTALNLDDVIPFFKSVALARALAVNTTTKFEPEMSNTVVNLMYNIMPWKERFGTMVLQQPPKRALAKSTNDYFVRFVDGWLKALGQGAAPVKNYMDGMQKTRDMDRDTLNKMIEDNARINHEVFSMMRDHIRAMAAVQASATIISAGLGAAVAITVGAGGALIACGVSTGRGVISDIAKHWNDVPSAKVLGVSIEVAKAGAERYADRKLVEQAFERANDGKDIAQDIILTCQKTINQYSALIAAGVKKSVRGQYKAMIRQAQADQIAAQDALKATAATAKNARFAGKAIPIAAAVVDSGIALWDLHEVWEETEDRPRGGSE